MAQSIRVLVVEDFEPFRRFVVSTLQEQPELEVICEVSDGLDAVQKANQLQPDLVVLDIGLPGLNGIEVAQRISNCSPMTKILALSENRSRAVVEEAMRNGASGYVLKSDASRDLLPAIEAVLRGERFVGDGFELRG